MKGQTEDLQMIADKISNGEDIHISENASELWKNVVAIRNFLREKKQEFVSHQNMSASRTTNTITIVRRSSATNDSLRQQKMKEYTLRIRNSMAGQVISSSPGSSVVNKGMRRLMTFEGDAGVTSQSTEAQEFTEPEFVQPPETYEEFLDVLIEKLDLLMELEQPLDLNNQELTELSSEMIEEWNDPNFDSPTHSMSKSQLNEERGLIPISVSELITFSVKKLLMLFIPASVNDIRRTLQARTENARTLQRAIDDIVVMLKTTEDFPQAARLFLLGVSNALVNWKGGKAAEGFHRDYLHHTEGCSAEAYKALLDSWRKFGEYLIELFQKCMINLNWRLGCATLFMLVTMSSPKIPYFCLSLNLPSLIQSAIHNLSNWYGRLTDHTEEILISPGPLWDHMAEKLVPLTSPHFRGILEEFKNRGNYLRMDQKVSGVFPISLMILVNVLRVCYELIIVDQVSKHRYKSVHSAAQNRESLFFWTSSDVSNLFIRTSKNYLNVTNVLLRDFVRFIHSEQQVFTRLCQKWQPFAHSLYALNTSINPNVCVCTKHEEKNNLQGSIEMDCCVSAGEAMMTCLMGLLVFVCKTDMRVVLHTDEVIDLGLDMMHLSPRIQRLMLMVLQNLSDRIVRIPERSCVNHQFLKPTESVNPLLVVPSDLPEKARKHLFMYHLLHLTSHADSCVSALLGERASCALCCPYDAVLFNLFSSQSPCVSSDRAALLEQLHGESTQTVCEMCIRPDGHGASYSAEIVAEEAVYTLRRLLAQREWKPIICTMIKEVVEGARATFKNEKNVKMAEEKELFLRTPCVTALIGVLKVLGGLSPRLYSGCRIRAHEFLLEGSSDPDDLMHTAYSSGGSGYVIQGNRTMSEVTILMDKIDTPRQLSIYALDVLDREHVPLGLSDCYCEILPVLESILMMTSLSNNLFSMPSRTMPFFNTTGLPLRVSSLQDAMIVLHLIRSLHSIFIASPDLVQMLQQPTIAQILRIAVKPIACNMPLSTSVMRQYYNWFVEYLINTYPGSPRFLPMELQSETSKVERERRRSYSATFGIGKDEKTDRWDDCRPAVLRDEKREKLAKTISGITGYAEDICYKLLCVCDLRVFSSSHSKITWILQCLI